MKFPFAASIGLLVLASGLAVVAAVVYLAAIVIIGLVRF
jgi:hypothetical protein